MTEQLKPCPFCGGDAKYKELNGEYQNVVKCNDDTCAGWDGVWGDYIDDPTTIPRWNTRPEVTPQEAAKVLLGDRRVVADLAIETMRNHKAYAGTGKGGYLPAVKDALRAISEDSHE